MGHKSGPPQGMFKDKLAGPSASPSGKGNAPVPSPRQDGCNLKARLKENHAPHMAQLKQTRSSPRGQPHHVLAILSHKKWGYLDLPIVLWRHKLGLMTF